LSFGKVLSEDEAMNILYASDDGYAIPTCVSIASILANCPSENKLNIIIVDTGMSEKSRKAIENLKKIRDFQLEFRKFDMPKIDKFNVGNWSSSIRLKLYINELFPGADKAMWVNGNIILRKNIRYYYDIDLNGKYFAVADGRTKTSINLKKDDYASDSFVLYNIKSMLQDDIFDRLIEYVNEHQHTQKATAGEHALVAIPKDKRILYGLDRFTTIHYADVDGCYNYTKDGILKYSERYGYAPWKCPRFLYPGIAIETYDEWHKYCDMTGYKGLKERLWKNCTIQGVLNAMKQRCDRLWNVKYKMDFYRTIYNIYKTCGWK